MKKILIIGSCGSGKSTLAKKLSQKLSLPLISLDQYYWKSGWVRSSKDEWREKVQELVEKDKWIMDGNYQSTFDIRVPASDAIIFLNFNRFVCFWRLLKRRILKNRVNIIDGCPERIDLKMIQWVLWEHPQRRGPITLELLKKESANKKIIIIESNKDLDDLIKKF